MKKKIALLGSTGSIGTQTLEVIDEFSDDFQVSLLSGHKNGELLKKQAVKYKPAVVVVTDQETFFNVEKDLSGLDIKVLYGEEDLLNSLSTIEMDLVVGGISGAAGIKPILKALELGIDVALANKETIVVAGDLVKELQIKYGSKLIPVDSEHSAIFQCLEPQKNALDKIILTASGGPFRNLPMDELKNVTPERALKHPNWEMGKKITIDSATLMNKGLEVIEAHFLFDVGYDDIQVVIHPQSIIHSMVQYGDGSILAQLGLPDMRVPIQYALTYPIRMHNSFEKLDLTKISSLEFFPPDTEKFPCLKLAYEAGRTGYTMPAALNAANEVAVDLFLKGKLLFTEIANLVQWVLEQHIPLKEYNLEELLAVDSWAREVSRQYKYQR